MKLLLELETDNAAFDYGNRSAETARILRELASQIEEVPAVGNFTLKDVNGNRVGFAKWHHNPDHD